MSSLVDHHEAKKTLRHRKTSLVGHRHPVNLVHHEDRTTGERLADSVASGIGSWRFLIIQSILLLFWVGFNVFGLLIARWDPYPFILLNLMLSVQAAYAAPVLLLASVRQTKKDRLTLEHAALEADKSGKQVRQILSDIEKNTGLTLQILQELEA